MFKLVLFLTMLLAGPVLAQNQKPVGKPNPRHRALKTTQAKRTNNKATFRQERHPLNLDLHVHDENKFFTAKGNRYYTSGKPGKNRASRTPDRPKVRVGKVEVGRRGGRNRTRGN